MKNRTTGMFAKIGLIVGSLFLCFVLLECISRLLFDAPTLVTMVNSAIPSGEQDIIAVGLPDKGLYIETPTGMRLKRNSRAIIKNHNLSRRTIEIRTNSLGFRYPELTPVTDSDFRILVLGDSITLGDYVAYEQTYPVAIENYLLQHPPNSLQHMRFQVMNAGVGAIDLQTEFAILTETGLSISPDIVLVALYLNDAVESPNIHNIRLSEPLNRSYFLSAVSHRIDTLRAMYENKKAERSFESSKERFKANHPLASVNWREADWRNDEAGFNLLISAAFHDWGYAWSEEFWQKAKELLVQMQELSADHQFELVVILLPVRYQVQSNILKNEPQQFFEHLMSELHLTHLDLLPALRRKYQEDRQEIFYDHCHYRPPGNEFIGKTIATFLLEHVFEDEPQRR